MQGMEATYVCGLPGGISKMVAIVTVHGTSARRNKVATGHAVTFDLTETSIRLLSAVRVTKEDRKQADNLRCCRFRPPNAASTGFAPITTS